MRDLVSLAQQRVYARPTTEEDARDALEWIAAREGKTLDELIEELRDSLLLLRREWRPEAVQVSRTTGTTPPLSRTTGTTPPLHHEIERRKQPDGSPGCLPVA